LLGDLQIASDAFIQAEKLEQEIYSQLNIRYLFSLRGIHHADHLRRTKQSDYARRVTEANLQLAERDHIRQEISQCHRVLGDLDSDSGNHESARAHYESALKIARGISHRPALIEALLARGRFYAKADLTGFQNLSGLGCKTFWLRKKKCT
jgi:tetratricopeptide (TPR) repeat protein